MWFFFICSQCAQLLHVAVAPLLQYPEEKTKDSKYYDYPGVP